MYIVVVIVFIVASLMASHLNVAESKMDTRANQLNCFLGQNICIRIILWDWTLISEFLK